MSVRLTCTHPYVIRFIYIHITLSLVSPVLNSMLLLDPNSLTIARFSTVLSLPISRNSIVLGRHSKTKRSRKKPSLTVIWAQTAALLFKEVEIFIVI